MGVQPLIDKHFPTQGNWQGQSLGSVAVIWLGYILLQADHRLNHVQTWPFKRLETLKTFFGEELGELDLTDDRLEALLRYLNCERDWYSLKSMVNLLPLSSLSLNSRKNGRIGRCNN